MTNGATRIRHATSRRAGQICQKRCKCADLEIKLKGVSALDANDFDL
jgi:hypothetical protein